LTTRSKSPQILIAVFDRSISMAGPQSRPFYWPSLLGFDAHPLPQAIPKQLTESANCGE
jgi:hypothetical protein